MSSGGPESTLHCEKKAASNSFGMKTANKLESLNMKSRPDFDLDVAVFRKKGEFMAY